MIRGKTLCVYLAVDPASSDGKYKPKDVSSSKKFARTPAMFRIKSDGALRKVLSLIDEITARCGLTRLDPPPPGVKAADFPFYTDAQLLDRGLIRPIKRGEDEQPDVEETDDRTDEFATKEEADDAFSRSKTPQKAYDDAVKTLEELFGRHDVFGEIKSALSDGIATVESSEKTAFRGLDEKWIKAIEDCLPAIDSLVRNPSHHIRETEEVLPIELTKKITGRSVQHLGRHADYITVTEDGEITPTKILNVFRDDSIETYENKFLNTLLARLDSFVGTRYEAGRKYGADEKSRTVALTDVFNLGELRGRIKISLELSEPYEGKDVGKTVRGTELWRRLCAVRDVIATYRNSAFAREMGNAFVYPPVARTNAIMKNKYFRQCLELWELINSYEDEGEGFTISEKFFEPEETADARRALARDPRHAVTQNRAYGCGKNAIRAGRAAIGRRRILTARRHRKHRYTTCKSNRPRTNKRGNSEKYRREKRRYKRLRAAARPRTRSRSGSMPSTSGCFSLPIITIWSP